MYCRRSRSISGVTLTFNCFIQPIIQPRAVRYCGSVLVRDSHGEARTDHAPEYAPAFHVPVTTARIADSKRSARSDLDASAVSAVHVPEYSPPPATMARQAPFHACGDFACRPTAAHEDLAGWLAQRPCARYAATLLVGPSAVQVPPKLRPLVDDALQDPRISAPEARTEEAASIARANATDILLNLARRVVRSRHVL